MNGRRREKKTGGRSVVKIVLAVILFVVIGMKTYELYEISEKHRELQLQLEQIREKNTRLEEEKAALETPERIEQIARDELGLVKPGEIPYVK